MNAPLRRAGLVLGTLAAAWLAAACADSATAPAAPSAPSLTAAPVAPEDSVCSGYGCPPTGGIEYECFEYDPATQTEYVCTEDPYPGGKGLISTGDTTTIRPR